MITPTITLRQNTAVSSLSNRDEYSLQCVCNVRVCMCDVGIWRVCMCEVCMCEVCMCEGGMVSGMCVDQ